VVVVVSVHSMLAALVTWDIVTKASTALPCSSSFAGMRTLPAAKPRQQHAQGRCYFQAADATCFQTALFS